VTRPLRLAVIGDPISHSRSPAIHNAALAALGIEGSYHARRVRGSEIEDVFADLRSGALDGINVTMPLKGVAAALVDELDPDARRAGSVNTVVRRPDGTLVGYSTDTSALRRLWPGEGRYPTLILGAGGAAAAACLAARGRSLYVSARRAGAASALATSLEMTLMEIPWGAAVVDAVLVNATPLGMHGEPLEARLIGLAASLIDLAYGDETTPAVSEARAAGIPTIDGIDFLVAQAADAFSLWTGREAPIEAMVAAARNHSRDGAPTPNDL
jgi:shikimate dehydrogenase